MLYYINCFSTWYVRLHLETHTRTHSFYWSGEFDIPMATISRPCNHVCYYCADVNYLEENAGGPHLIVATLPNSGKVVLLKVSTPTRICGLFIMSM